MKKIIVVNDVKHWKIKVPSVEVVSAMDYITNNRYADLRGARVFNLCDSFGYQTRGYYVSLLGLARGHFVIPNARTLLDLGNPVVVRLASEELVGLIQRKLKPLRSEHFTLSIYFGQNIAAQYTELASRLSEILKAPLIRAYFVKQKDQWILQKVKPIAVSDIPEEHLPYVKEFANAYFKKRTHSIRKDSSPVYSLAILVNEEEIAPPSNRRALKKFSTIGRQLGFETELISASDYNRLPAFDALFIREDTKVHHHTYRFASRAQAEGLAVIDSPDAILRCNNKVFLEELLRKNDIATPDTIIFSKRTAGEVPNKLGYPFVVKLPDSSSSLGVFKVSNKIEFEECMIDLFRSTELAIAQGYIPTDYDWRIGILDGVPLFACKYFMAKDHWQIYNWDSKERSNREGAHETIPIEQAPRNIVECALKAVSLIGEGLFGVDLKEYQGKPIVIEVNENPNIDAGVEDQVLGDELYKHILRAFRRRVEQRVEDASQRFPVAI